MNLITENEMLKRDIAELEKTVDNLNKEILVLTEERDKFKASARRFSNKAKHIQERLEKLRSSRELFNTHSDTKKVFYSRSNHGNTKVS